MNRIPEPYEIADAYFAKREAEWEAMLKASCCEDCGNYNEAPPEWSDEPHGWCAEKHEHVRACQQVYGWCEGFEPR